ncbi:acetoin utilization AcuB family protein [Evansella sp. AB-P1]|uniref:acetoin utilization AcuB family protein n=1 Tax=Evansella sp. AB-P1 TaxID=3037653 RepID=UPI00241E7312|nr:acetoin utilization AcuB family protein [Evansella sp. AB-P1]MDG5787025.1 acetoin utilization AcuB family protein [Evansella sp. AB-P1]
MIIKDIMITDVKVSSPHATLKDALQVMVSNEIRHLPIVNDENEIIGIISDRDIKDASPSIFDNKENEFLNKQIEDIMIKDVLTALPNDFVEDAAKYMTDNQISCLPIEDNGKLIGIITETDLLFTLVKLTGADLPSSRLEIEVPNLSGMLSDVATIIKSHNVNIHSVLVYPSSKNNKKVLVFRLQVMDVRQITNTLKEKGYTILWPSKMERNI